MSRPALKRQLKYNLPDRLWRALESIAFKYKDEGLKLFIFGSFAQLKNKSTSDLDIGVCWVSKRDPLLFNQLYLDIQELPTIRKIDLVDMSQVDESFRQEALEHAYYLINHEKR